MRFCNSTTLHQLDSSLSTVFRIGERLRSVIKSNYRENYNYKGKDPNQNWISILLLSLALFFATNNIIKYFETPKIPETDSKENSTSETLFNFNDLHQKLVIANFQIEFWKYVSQNSIQSVNEFSTKDKINLRETLWKIIIKAREQFAKIKGMNRIVNYTDEYYTYNKFKIDFDNFFRLNAETNLVLFESEMVEYMRVKQREITKAAFNNKIAN